MDPDIDYAKLARRTRLYLVFFPIVLLLIVLLRVVFEKEEEELPPYRYTPVSDAEREELSRIIQEHAAKVRKRQEEAEKAARAAEAEKAAQGIIEPPPRPTTWEELERELREAEKRRRLQRPASPWDQPWPNPYAERRASPPPPPPPPRDEDPRRFQSVREVGSIVSRFEISRPVRTAASSQVRHAVFDGDGAPAEPAPHRAAQPAVWDAERIDDRTLLEGSLIPAILAEPANTDEPGLVTAYVRADVRDSLTGRNVLIPAGTRAVGRVTGRNASDTATEIEWTRLILPGGVSVDVLASASDPGGGGATGRRRSRSLQKVGAVLTSAVASAAVQLSQRPQSSDRQFFSPGQIAAEEAARDAGRVLDDWAKERLSLPPTILLPIGAAIRIKVEQDLVLPGELKRREQTSETNVSVPSVRPAT